MKIKVDMKEIKALEKDLEIISRKSIPYATRQAINDAAFYARKTAANVVERKMTLRNKYTAKSILVEKSKTLDINKQESLIGSVATYMALQEFGGQRKGEGGDAVSLPTSIASGHGRGVQRTRAVKKQLRMSNIKIGKGRISAKSKKHARFLAVKSAQKQNKKFFYMTLSDNRRGIFRLSGSKKKPKVDMIHDLTKKSYNVKATHWLRTSALIAQRRLPVFYEKALAWQLNNLK